MNRHVVTIKVTPSFKTYIVNKACSHSSVQRMKFSVALRYVLSNNIEFEPVTDDSDISRTCVSFPSALYNFLTVTYGSVQQGIDYITKYEIRPRKSEASTVNVKLPKKIADELKDVGDGSMVGGVIKTMNIASRGVMLTATQIETLRVLGNGNVMAGLITLIGE